MNTENGSLDHSAHHKVVKDVGAVAPCVRVAILSHRLVVKTINRGDLPRFVVAPEQRDMLGVLELQAHQQGKSLQRVVAAVNIIAHKNVRGVGNLSALGE